MFMKHYAPNRCEPIIKFRGRGRGGGGGGVRADVNGEVVFVKFQKKKIGGGRGRVRGGVRVDVNGEVKFL